jgi:hypothetical protein
MGDERSYENVIALRAVNSLDGMTAEWSHLPHELLAEISSEIMNKVKGSTGLYMTSAPSHLQRLSGNRFFPVWILLLAMIACAGPKRVAHKPSDKHNPTEEEQVRVYDPATGTYILVPRSAVKVDTVKWAQETQPPLVTDKVVDPDKPNKKNSYQISLLMPFSAIDVYGEEDFSGKVNRFLQYYGGVQLAMKEIDPLKSSISLHTYDAGATLAQTQSVLNEPSVKNSDVIIGPL